MVPPKMVESQNFEISLVIFMFWLGTRERMMLAARVEELVVRTMQVNQNKHNYNISSQYSQVQVELNFSLPVVFMMIYAQNLKLVEGRQPDFINFSGPNGVDPIQQMQLDIGVDQLTQSYPGVFWRVVMPWVFFNHIPRLWQYVMVFATHPSSMEELTGSLNMIPLSSVRLNIGLAGPTRAGEMFTYVITVFASVAAIIRYGGATAHKLFS